MNYNYKKLPFLFLLTPLFLILVGGSGMEKHPNWGFFGHKRINRMAVFTLPPEMMVFYKKNIEYITEHAVDPDKRRYATKLEAFRHYMDMDHWGKSPFPNVPRYWTDALARYTDVYAVTPKNDTFQLFGDAVTRVEGKVLVLKSMGCKRLFGKDSLLVDYKSYRNLVHDKFEPQYYEGLDVWKVESDSLLKLFKNETNKPKIAKVFALDRFTEYGIVPYHTELMQRRLTLAFKEKNSQKILRISAELGHYIGDAHVPLHTTENYNGQMTGQVGIHGFWESRLPELFADEEYDFFVGKTRYIDNFHDFIWKGVLDSHALLDTVLFSEKEMVKYFPRDKQMCYEDRADLTVLTQCKDFARAWHTRMKGMVEKRMRDAIVGVGSAWYTAWVDAGQPDLGGFSEPVLDKEEEELQQEIKKVDVETGKMIGRPEH